MPEKEQTKSELNLKKIISIRTEISENKQKNNREKEWHSRLVL